MPHKDPAVARAWRKEYRKKNKEAIRAKEREYYHNVHKHKDYIKQQQSEHRRTIQSRFARAKKKAEYKNTIFTLSKEEYESEIQKSCYYCANSLKTSSEVGIGLDRLIPDQGYVLGNVVSCCYTCNRIKGDDLTPEETTVAVQAILSFRKAKTDGTN